MTETCFDMMHAIYMSGDVDLVERCLQTGIDPNLPDVHMDNMGEILVQYFDSNWELFNAKDDLGLFWHIFNGGSLITMAMICKHLHRNEMIRLLLRYGIKVKDSDVSEALTDPFAFAMLVENESKLVTQELVLDAFRRAPIEVIRYIYEKVGIRMSRHDRNEISNIIFDREEQDDDEFYEWMKKFTSRHS